MEKRQESVALSVRVHTWTRKEEFNYPYELVHEFVACRSTSNHAIQLEIRYEARWVGTGMKSLRTGAQMVVPNTQASQVGDDPATWAGPRMK